MSRISIHLPEKDFSLVCENKKSIKDILSEQGIALKAPCGGNGTCGKCQLSLTDSSGSHQVLACQTKIQEDCEITIPASSLLEKEMEINEKEIASHQAFTSDLKNDSYAVAVDLGSTTVVAALVDLDNGSLVDLRKEWNALIPYGSDVISRVKYIMDHENGLEHLSTLLHEQLLSMIMDMYPQLDKISKIHIAGNTIMEHIFAIRDPSSITVTPYKAETLFTEGQEYFFDTFSSIPVYFLPCISGYVGGDIVAGLYYTSLVDREATNLFLDIGTNGEMAMAKNGQIQTVSVATGPAFEGAQITCGMTGVAGAISHIDWQENLCKMPLSVIGNDKPQGLCGSGLIDLISILIDVGYIDQTGHLLSPGEARKAISTLTHARFKNCLGYKFLQMDEEENVRFYLQYQPAIYLTNQDIRNLQLAKASVAAGIHFLIKESKISYEEIDHIYIAGGFGEHINSSSACKIGMIPGELKEKIVSLGNTSLQGCIQSLTDQKAWESMTKIIEKCEYTELSGNAHFSQEFIDQINF